MEPKDYFSDSIGSLRRKDSQGSLVKLWKRNATDDNRTSGNGTAATMISPTTSAAPTNVTQIVYPDEVTSSHMLTYVLIPLGAVIFALLITAFVVFMLKKNRLDKLRHHLMPLYNFDPAEEGEDWETELLEDGMDHRMGPRVRSPALVDEPKLAFRGDSGL